ncbi:ATP-dependent RNA helicase HrpA [Gammaproteobacteria bacterium]|nr:ATP-dependent RNA helicase HrpA [Gammaproteobacteria bacterium]
MASRSQRKPHRASRAPSLTDAQRHRLDGVRCHDRHRLARQWQRGDAGVEDAIAASAADVLARGERVPPANFPDLPITARRDEIIAAIRQHQVLILCGETGSGKSTQLPPLCLAAGRGQRGIIGHTQPRRIAARSVAARIAEEMGSALGSLVGYRIRFNDQSNDDNLIRVLTDGMLLSELESDRWLSRYDTLILDEAHERSLNIDFLLGALKRLLRQRPDLKLIVTSATIDPQRFSRHFDGAPILEVSGRSFPVELRYRPPADKANDDDLLDHCASAIAEAVEDGPGDVLCFLPGEKDIRTLRQRLQKNSKFRHLLVLPLYARLPPQEQQRVFHSGGPRRIVLATNVAETSITVPGIRYVVDTGTARISRYSPTRKVQRLPIEPIAQANADQRKGRCGRVAPGVCIRLYDEADFLSRPAFTEPELQRSSLAAVILRMLALGFGAPEDFPFIDPPEARQLNDGRRLLGELSAIDDEHRLTAIGKKLARLPLDPRLGRMLVEAEQLGVLEPVTVIAAALAVQDPRVVTGDNRETATTRHRELAGEAASDFIEWWQLWQAIERQRQDLSRGAYRKFLEKHHLAPMRVQEWREVHRQLLTLVRPPKATTADDERVHRAVLSGLLGNIAVQQEKREYRGTHGKVIFVPGGSRIGRQGAKLIVAAELVETNRLYARTAAAIKAQWIEQLSAKQLQRRYSEPHWMQRSGKVMAWEQLSLYGLVFVEKRRVHFGPIDAATSREMFIRHALINDEIDRSVERSAPFIAHNRQLIGEIEAMEQRVRRRDLLIDDEIRYRWFDARIPDDVWSVSRLQAWYREAAKGEPTLLYLSEDELAAELDREQIDAAFPREAEVAATRLVIDYQFEPGRQDDGSTITVPLSRLGQMQQQEVDWAIPGQVEERLIALIRSLPKSLRKQFVPAPDVVRRLLPTIDTGNAPMSEALAMALRRLRPQSGIRASDFAVDSLPLHLRPQLRVVDDAGAELAQDRDLAALQSQFDQAAERAFQQGTTWRIESSAHVRWDFGELPERIEQQQGGAQVIGYPALVDDGESVAVRVFDHSDTAARSHSVGLARLLRLADGDLRRQLKKGVPDFQRIAVMYASVSTAAELHACIEARVIESAFLDNPNAVRDASAFDICLAQGLLKLGRTLGDTGKALAAIMQRYHEASRAIDGCPTGWEATISDCREQLMALVHPGFLAGVSGDALGEMSRYLHGITRRIEQARSDYPREQKRMAEFAPQRERLQQALAIAPDDLAVDAFRWTIEEYRIALFAQDLGTRQKVSAKRLDTRWQALQSEVLARQ